MVLSIRSNANLSACNQHPQLQELPPALIVNLCFSIATLLVIQMEIQRLKCRFDLSLDPWIFCSRMLHEVRSIISSYSYGYYLAMWFSLKSVILLYTALKA